jgi:hypothetical protein
VKSVFYVVIAFLILGALTGLLSWALTWVCILVGGLFAILEKHGRPRS